MPDDRSADPEQHPVPSEPPEAPPRPSGRGRRTVLGLILVLVIVGAGGLAVRNARHYFASPSIVQPPGPAHVPLPEDFGDPNAPLKIEVCVGPCITYVADAIATTFRDRPDKVRAEFHDYESEDGAKFVQTHGLSVACIFINGKNRFTIHLEGKKKEVHLVGPPPEGYTMRELAAVLRQQWRQVITGKEDGKLPEGLEEKLAKFGQAAGGCQAGGIPAPQQARSQSPSGKAPGKTPGSG